MTLEEYEMPILAAVTGGSLYFLHDYAHSLYGASEAAIGSVGLSISLLAVAGFYLNRAALSDN
jgi:hypothetical protein